MNPIDDEDIFSEEDFANSIADDDYVFIVDAQGQLKTMLFPDDNAATAAPENVEKILQIFGMCSSDNQTIH